MFGGIKHSSYVGGALLAACMLATGSANAADLGGGCCADLEERVAELEATTARKGNRVVSLQIGGQVNNALLIWDNGDESDAYIVGATPAQTWLNFTGEGRINESTKAGFLLQLGIWSESSFGVSEENDESPLGSGSDSIFIRHSMLYIENDRLGRVSIGQTSPATDGIMEINLARSAIIGGGAAQLWNGNFSVIDSGGLNTGARWRDLMGGNTTQSIGETNRYDIIKYDTPSIAGFKLSAAWGENDFYDIALRYAGQWNSFKVAAGVGYNVWNGDPGTPGIGNAGESCISDFVDGDADCHELGMSAGVMHVPTGLFAHVAYGIKTDENVPDGFDDESTHLYVQAGIEKNWFGIGSTTLYGEYGHIETGFFQGAETVVDAEVDIWGVGIVQNIASAATDLYLTYRNHSAEATIDGDDGELSDFNTIIAGARITF